MAPHPEATTTGGIDLEKSSTESSIPGLAWLNSDKRYSQSANPFIGRLGGNQAFALDRNNAKNASTLELEPDAAPGMTLRQQFDLRGFKSAAIWKAALMEGVGMSLFCILPCST